MFENPNILVIMVDDLRPDLGVYGHPTAHTPRIDTFARTALTFDNAFVSMAVCGPSRAAMLTGLRPDTTGIKVIGNRVDQFVPWVQTMPQLFRQNGYNTIRIGKVYHDNGDDAPGWTEEIDSGNPVQTGGDLFAKSYMRWADGQPLQDTLNVAKAVDALPRLKTDGNPFFMAVGIRKPHLPFVVPDRFWNLYSEADLPDPVAPNGMKNIPSWSLVQKEIWQFEDLAVDRPTLPYWKQRDLRWGYLAAVSYVDSLVGQLLDGLNNNGLADNTIVVLWSDHGFKLGDYGFWAKQSTIDMDIRVPMIIRVPKYTPAGERTSGLVEAVDIYPTLAELAGLDAKWDLEGQSFATLLAFPDFEWKEAIYAQYPREAYDTGGQGDLMGYTIRTAEYRYTVWERPDGSVADTELFDLTIDPHEEVNRVSQSKYADAIKKMEQLRRRGWEKVRGSVRVRLQNAGY